MPKLALYVPLKAKPGKESDVADFLTSALPLVKAEPGTLTCMRSRKVPVLTRSSIRSTQRRIGRRILTARLPPH